MTFWYENALVVEAYDALRYGGSQEVGGAGSYGGHRWKYAGDIDEK